MMNVNSTRTVRRAVIPADMEFDPLEVRIIESDTEPVSVELYQSTAAIPIGPERVPGVALHPQQVADLADGLERLGLLPLPRREVV